MEPTTPRHPRQGIPGIGTLVDERNYANPRLEMPSYRSLLLILVFVGCATAPNGKTPSNGEKAPNVQVLDFKDTNKLIHTVVGLKQEAKEGKRTIVEVQVETTVGWGGPSPPFVLAGHNFDDLDLLKNPEAFFGFHCADGVPDINQFIGAISPKGRYFVTGYYTGLFVGEDPNENKPRPVTPFLGAQPNALAFHVLRWCYQPPKSPEGGMSRGALEELRKKGVPWCGQAP